MALINQVPTGAVADEKGSPVPAFAAFFSQLGTVLQALTLSGTTANRPTKLLWIGRPYFDTSLTKPIWVKAVSAAGVATWGDATGATV